MNIETKYNLTDKVWYMRDNQIKESEITYIYSTTSNTMAEGQTTWIEYGIAAQSGTLSEKILYPSKQDLLNSL